jgi:intracellular septation protein
MKSLLDFSPAAAFFVAYLLHDIYVATAVVIVALFVVVVVYAVWERRLHKLHFVAAVAAALFGGLTLAVQDPEFIKLKPTAVYTLFALVLLGSHVVGQRVLLSRLPQKLMTLPTHVWRRVNFAWGLFFLGLALLNLYVAYQLSEATWVKFRTFGFSILTFLFLLAHFPFLAKYLPHEERIS